MLKATKARRAVFGVLPIIALMFGYQEVFMSQATANGGVKNVVLVHGGFVDGSGWQGVYDTAQEGRLPCVDRPESDDRHWRTTSR